MSPPVVPGLQCPADQHVDHKMVKCPSSKTHIRNNFLNGLELKEDSVVHSKEEEEADVRG